MKDLISYFEAFYAADNSPYIVFDKNGNLVWQNPIAVRYTANGVFSPSEIFSEIILHSDNSGMLVHGYGGKFSKAVYENEEYFVAEMYNDNHVFELLTDMQAADFILKNDTFIRTSVTGISASCNALSFFVNKYSSKEAKKYINAIMAHCCQIIRKTEIEGLLVNIAVNKENEVIIDVDKFIIEFVANCSCAIDKSFNVETKNTGGGCISVNKAVFMYFMLCLFRQLISGLRDGAHIEISSVLIGDTVEIIFELLSKNDNKPIKIKTSEAIGFDDKTLEYFKKYLSAEYSFDNNKLSVKMKTIEADPDSAVNQTPESFDENKFSPYNIMLNDSLQYRDFY